MLAGCHPVEYSGGGQGLTQAVVPEKKTAVTIFHFQSCLPNEIWAKTV